MPDNRNRTSVLRQLAALQKMKLPELQDKWRDLYGTEPPNFGRKFMFQQLAYRVQELFYGGLKPEVKERLKQAADPDSAATEPAKPDFTIGTKFIRVWNKCEYEVTVVSGGFEHQGQKFKSLTAIAEKITGVHRNGRKFFGLPASSKAAVKNN
jgi:hypothetical protein